MRLALSFLVATVFCSTVFAADVEQYDIVIYGGTSSGVVAGVQGKRLGKSVVVIEPTKFVGGLTTGGLGATDIGNKRAIGGISREFYHRIWEHYKGPKEAKAPAGDVLALRREQGKTDEKETMWTFEPHVATQIYADMLAEAQVPVVFGERLDLKNGVKKDGARITEIVMESGRRFGGKVFIDASYEGDLMAKAGLSYHVGREANAEYGETIDGVQLHTAGHNFVKKIDPYITPGDPKSGVIFGIQTDGPGPEFSGDKRIQAYNFRMCTTDVPENRIPWQKPENYDEKMFELALRNIEAGDYRAAWNPVRMPNGKTDTNNNGPVSSDYIGMNYEYPDADYATRERITKAHEQWQKGLMWTYANHPRVPEKVQQIYQKFGLAKDEFLDNDHWPRQLYVREARRMMSDYIMTEHNCRREIVAEDSIGMGAYNMDSHHTQRYITKEGAVRNEGDVQIGTHPYPISYKSIVPKADQCTNLVVPVCLSSSHIAFGSIRMEPVFMVLGQSSATAAVQAIDQGVDVQKVDYAKLKAKLLEDHQILDFIPTGAKMGVRKSELGGIVVDDTEAELTGFTTKGASAAPHVGAGYAHDGNAEKGKQIAVFKTRLPASGAYEVRFAYTALANRATNVPVTVKFAGGEKKIIVNEQKKAPIDGYLLSLGTFQFDAEHDAIVQVSNEGTDGHVIIDAVQWLPAETKP